MKVFITGGTTGIGPELVKLFLAQGDEVAVCGRDERKFHESFPEGAGARPKFYQVDVTHRETLITVVNDFARGHLDLVIANAGISMGSKTRRPDFDRIRQVVDTNFYGVLNTFEAALPNMKKGGHLVAMASVAGFVGLPGASAYSASKSAVLRLCETFGIDLKREGISVTAIAPGFIDTPLTRKNPHPMPFLMDAPKGARLIFKAIKQKKSLYVFPWQMKICIYLLSWLPRDLYRWLMSFKFANYSKSLVILLLPLLSFVACAPKVKALPTVAAPCNESQQKDVLSLKDQSTGCSFKKEAPIP